MGTVLLSFCLLFNFFLKELPAHPSLSSTLLEESTMMRADDEINNERSNNQRRISLTKSSIVGLVPKIDYKNLALVLLFYLSFYSFLYGFYMLLLEGVTATSSVGKQHTLLWTFFYLGIAFTVVVSGITLASQWAEKKEIDRLITGSESSLLLLNEPPPPPSRDAATVASGMDTSGEESGEEEVEQTLSDVGRRILAVAARRESDTSLVELANNVCERSKTTTPQK